MTEQKHIAEVDGKHLRDWWNDAPAGAFAHAVRQTIDPYYGLSQDPIKKWEIHARITEVYDDYYKVEAACEKEARDKAYGMWLGFHDVEILSAKPLSQESEKRK